MKASPGLLSLPLVVLVGMMLVWTGSARAQQDLVLVSGPRGDLLSEGLILCTTNRTDMRIWGTPARINVAAFDFNVVFQSPGNSNLTAGQYLNAVSSPSDAGSPALSFG